MKKKYDAVVVIGKYTDNQGQEKKRYKNVGVVMESDKGLFLILDATFNPAGIQREAGKEGVFVSFFEPKGQATPQADNGVDGDSIPF